MRIEPQIAWCTAGREGFVLDPRLVPLLREIQRRATLRAATREVGLSYRAAWDLLGAQSRALGAPLVVMKRGRGASLSSLAERLVAADDAARAELDAARERLAVPVEAVSEGAPLRLVASQDPLLAEFAAQAKLPLEITFRGSLESLAAFGRGEADLAGFHVSAGQADVYRRFIRPRRDRLIRFAQREQGLMVAAGNPKRLASLADVAALGLRFVNRQRGSGTRHLVDELLREAGITPAALQGYGDEEFTHPAVAATVAAGRVDAGVGVRAAAARYGLGFIPLRSEMYWLLAPARALGEPRFARLLDALRKPDLARLAERLGGYDATGAGDVHPASALAATR